jgi:hypothetical protein
MILLWLSALGTWCSLGWWFHMFQRVCINESIFSEYFRGNIDAYYSAFAGFSFEHEGLCSHLGFLWAVAHSNGHSSLNSCGDECSIIRLRYVGIVLRVHLVFGGSTVRHSCRHFLSYDGTGSGTTIPVLNRLRDCPCGCIETHSRKVGILVLRPWSWYLGVMQSREGLAWPVMPLLICSLIDSIFV